MKLLTVATLSRLIKSYGLQAFYHLVINDLEQAFSQWHRMIKEPRMATHVERGVLELMPCSDGEFYSFKYVNGHPANTHEGKMCVVAFGMLAECRTGYPILLSEMTLLTAIRTAATAALAAKYLARPDSCNLAIIGTGAQSEFQVLAIAAQFPLTDVYFFDVDTDAMNKFARNLSSENFTLHPCVNIENAVSYGDIVVTATADKNKNQLISPDMIRPGTHIQAMGGDCPGKTEFYREVLLAAKVVVEYLPQSLKEGEVQNVSSAAVYAELWELIAGEKVARENDKEITLFDSVGFALEDLSILKSVHSLLETREVDSIDLVPNVMDPKDLYSLIR